MRAEGIAVSGARTDSITPCCKSPVRLLCFKCLHSANNVEYSGPCLLG